MKFNPYPVFLTTGALMFATVVLAQTGSGVALLKAGAASVNQDVSTFAVKTIASLGSRAPTPALVARDDAVADAPVADATVPNTRVAALDNAH